MKLNPKLLGKMKDVTKKEIDEKRKESIAAENEERIKRNKNSTRNSSADIINLEIDENDDEMVACIKENINNAEITLDHVYEVAGRRVGWNLYYGLTTRNSTTLKSFIAWAEILDLEVVVDLVEPVRHHKVKKK